MVRFDHPFEVLDGVDIVQGKYVVPGDEKTGRGIGVAVAERIVLSVLDDVIDALDGAVFVRDEQATSSRVRRSCPRSGQRSRHLPGRLLPWLTYSRTRRAVSC